MLTHAAHTAIGGVEGALARHADASFALLDPAEQREARRLADDRLVGTSRNAVGDDTVEVVHEALLRHWGKMRGAALAEARAQLMERPEELAAAERAFIEASAAADNEGRRQERRWLLFGGLASGSKATRAGCCRRRSAGMGAEL